jgi:hypothetical protein
MAQGVSPEFKSQYHKKRSENTTDRMEDILHNTHLKYIYTYVCIILALNNKRTNNPIKIHKDLGSHLSKIHQWKIHALNDTQHHYLLEVTKNKRDSTSHSLG